MSVVIVGGNECMERQYIDLCSEYKCTAKVITKMRGTMHNKVGTPDLLVLFTGTMSHKMLNSALCELQGKNTRIVRSHTSSQSALRSILQEHVN